ncbi:MAG: SPASM domain-containing protein, partial [Chloroflexi bacterium]|nr:SPASM domain-containing protein [Chloroflexota bacterium]
QNNAGDLDEILDLVEREGIPRLCIYHLAYAGRGRQLLPMDLDDEQRRKVIGRVFEYTLDTHRRGKEVEVLTVDNHTDGAFLVMWAEKHAPDRVSEMLRLLARNGGNSAGKGIGCIDERGIVHPDQFWRWRSVGNVRDRPFSTIWTDDGVSLLRELRDRHSLLPEMCTTCRFLPHCNGNLRARADAATGDPWGEDPACYLTSEERLGA